MGFTSLGLSAPILKAIEEKGYNTPSPIQLQAIPAVLAGKDVMPQLKLAQEKRLALRYLF